MRYEKGRPILTKYARLLPAFTAVLVVLLSACAGEKIPRQTSLSGLGISITVPPGFEALSRETIEKLGESADVGIVPFTVQPRYGFRNTEKKSFFIVSSAIPDPADPPADPLASLYLYRENFEAQMGTGIVSDVEIGDNMTVLVMNVLLPQEDGDMLLTRGLYYLDTDEFVRAGSGRYFMLDLYLNQKNETPGDIEGYRKLMFSITANP
ncbi:MAG: hypothetical protein LBG42_03005 [Treponema sp.]|jgi:hypothetical protein|nr:hypothetical protein [Treponema sp.]